MADPSVSATADFSIMLLGPSIPMSHLWLQIRSLAPFMRTLLLTGEPDCGAEAVASVFLQLSRESQRPFVKLHKSEAELRFARLARSPYLYDNTFYFIPEVGDLSLQAQEGLCRVLHNRRTNGVSVVASTSYDLSSLASIGTFLPQLSRSLGAVRVRVPKLSERAEDLPILLQQMIHRLCLAERHPVPQLSSELFHSAMTYPWAGNFRELAAICRELLEGQHGETHLDEKDWKRATQVLRRAEAASHVRLLTLKQIVNEHLQGVLVACEGKKSRAAEVLGISRSCLYRMLDESRHSTI